MTAADDVPRVTLREVDPLRELEFDPLNPRLSRSEEGASQADLLRIILRRFKVEELAESIVRSGYLPLDPMMACPRGELLVIREGNRRLAAIKLLLAPEMAPPRTRSRWVELANRLSERTRNDLRQLQV